MPDGFQRIDARLHHRTTRLAVDRRDESDAAGVVFLAGIVEMRRFEKSVVASECAGELRSSLSDFAVHSEPPLNPRPRNAAPQLWS